ARHAADLRLGPGLWLVLGGLAWTFFRTGRTPAKLFFLAAALPVLGLVRVPLISDFLVGSFPVDLHLVCDFPFALRLVPALAALIAMGGVVVLATEAPEQGRWRFWRMALLASGVGYAGLGALGSVQRARDATWAASATRDSFRPESRVLDRYAYNLLP